MRTLGLSILLGLAFAPCVDAQDPKVQPRTEPPRAAGLDEKNAKWLDAYLKAWDERMSKVNSLQTKIVLTEIEAGPPSIKTVYTGEASLLKPNYAKMLLKDSAHPSNSKKWRHFVANGEYLWEYDYGRKIGRVLQLPKDGVGDNTLMNVLFGIKAVDLKTRYEVSIDVDNLDKHNEFYLHIVMLPRTKEDQQEFKKAELVLWKNNKDPKYADNWMMPARLWFQHPNGNQVTWEFKDLTTQKKFLPMDFKEPGFPDKEWKPEWMRPPAPTVSRSKPPAK